MRKVGLVRLAWVAVNFVVMTVLFVIKSCSAKLGWNCNIFSVQALPH